MKIAWLFPGQGAQSVGMGKDVFDGSAAARRCFEEADAAVGAPLSTLCFEGPAEQLTLTENTQPAIVTTSMALVAAARERFGDRLRPPDFAAGHSLGEYSALCAAGAFSLADAARVTRTRGRAMQAAVAPGVGAMAAVMGLEAGAVEALCGEAAEGTDEVLSCANFNAPIQTVVAGHAAAVRRAVGLAKGRGGKAIPLKVSAPFHCALMAPARDPLQKALDGATVGAPAFPVLANVDAEPKTTPEAVVTALIDQVDSPVRWVAIVEALVEEGVTHALEIGPGRVLAGLAKKIDKRLQVLSVNGADALDKIPEFLGWED